VIKISIENFKISWKSLNIYERFSKCQKSKTRFRQITSKMPEILILGSFCATKTLKNYFFFNLGANLKLRTFTKFWGQISKFQNYYYGSKLGLLSFPYQTFFVHSSRLHAVEV
jgi:hypothetical protein